jgi:hypothetical protein
MYVHETETTFKQNVLYRYSRTPLIRTLVIGIAYYPDRLGPSGKFVENSKKITFLATDQVHTVLWLVELQIKRVEKFRRRKVP